MIVYHGSPNYFNKFDYNRIGENGTSEGFGFYFTDKKHIAENYVGKGYLYTVQLTGKELSGTKLTITEKQFKQLATRLNDEEGYLSNFGEIEYEGFENVLQYAVDLEYDSSDNDAELIGGIINAYGSKENVLQAVYDMFGYGYVKDDNCNWGNSKGNQTVYVALVNEVINIVEIQEEIQI